MSTKTVLYIPCHCNSDNKDRRWFSFAQLFDKGQSANFPRNSKFTWLKNLTMEGKSFALSCKLRRVLKISCLTFSTKMSANEPSFSKITGKCTLLKTKPCRPVFFGLSIFWNTTFLLNNDEWKLPLGFFPPSSNEIVYEKKGNCIRNWPEIVSSIQKGTIQKGIKHIRGV